MKIYLASKSPRRKELLTLMGVDFDLLLVDAPEIIAPNERPEDYSMRITKEKLEAAWQELNQNALPVLPVLCADTEVVLDDKILGKPESYDHAFNMIKSYSNRSHHVLTSVGVQYHDYQKILMNTTVVTFASMSDADIHQYLASGDYQGKSGAYGIQSYLGQFISKIDGCFYSVMGLPLNSVRLLLKETHT
ncbi:MAG: Maf family protein [Legionella sp.]|jgi:septum formation protein